MLTSDERGFMGEAPNGQSNSQSGQSIVIKRVFNLIITFFTLLLYVNLLPYKIYNDTFEYIKT